jgi:hypothetical protein
MVEKRLTLCVVKLTGCSQRLQAHRLLSAYIFSVKLPQPLLRKLSLTTVIFIVLVLGFSFIFNNQLDIFI